MARVGRVVTACGCIVLPDAVAMLDPKMAECPEHGFQVIERKATFREICTEVIGIQMPLYADDECPF